MELIPTRHESGYILDKSQVYYRSSTEADTINTYGHFTIISLQNRHVFGLWEKAGLPGENLHGHGENIRTERPEDLNTYLLFIIVKKEEEEQEQEEKTK